MSLPDQEETDERKFCDRPAKILQTALASLTEAVLVVRPDGRDVVACNAATEALFGYRPDELIGGTTEILHASREEFERFGELNALELRERGVFHCDWEMRRKDGSLFPTSHTVMQIDENLGLRGGVVNIVRDRSELERAARKLRVLEERYHVLFEENPEPMFVYDLDERRILAVNRALCKAYGRDRDALVGARPDALLAMEDRDAWETHATELEGRDEVRSRWQIHRADGSLALVDAVSTPVPFDGRRARLVVVADRTEQIHAERRAQRLLAILEATPDLVAIADEDERLEYLNPAGRRLMGLVEDRDVTEAVIGDYTPDWALTTLREEAFPQARKQGVWQGEAAVLHEDGTEIPVSQVVLFHAGQKGEPSYLSTIVRDMTARRQLEAQLRESQKMEALGRLAGGVAHNFNNALTAIIGHVELALGASDQAAVDKSLLEIEQAAERSARLTRRLLAIGSNQVLETEIFDLGHLLRETMSLLGRTLPASVKLSIELPQEPAPVEADPTQLQQVILNLAVNARDAMPDGGILTCRVDLAATDEARPARDAQLPPGDYVRLSVHDTGLGMSSETLSRIFEPFFTTKEAEQGTGLGLSTVHGIVQQSGGFLDVESAPGTGTEFRMYLPRVAGPAISSPARRQDVPRGRMTTDAKILIAEDEAPVREMLEKLLRLHGFDVVSAQCGAEALKLRRELGHSIDILVTDIVMPEMNGRELAQRVRELDPDVRVLYISGYSHPVEGSHRQLEDGAAFLPKPFTAEDLLHTIHTLLRDN